MSTVNVFQQLFAYTGPNLASNPERMVQFLFAFLVIVFATNIVISFVCGRLFSIILNVLLGWALITQVMEITNALLGKVAPFPVSGLPNINQLGNELMRALDSLSKFTY